MDSRFYDYVQLIIDNLEGGYFHPDMYKANPQKFAVYFQSGETMYGMDKVAGAGLFKNAAGDKFWRLIAEDRSKNPAKWVWNYKASGSLASELKKLVAEIMYAQFVKCADKYFDKSRKVREIVESSPKLMIHFFYACWNGEGYFKSFASTINNAVASGTKNTDTLAKVAMDSRRNYFPEGSQWRPQFVQGANSIETRIFPKLPAEGRNLSWLWWTLGGLTLAGVGVLGYTQGWFDPAVDYVTSKFTRKELK